MSIYKTISSTIAHNVQAINDDFLRLIRKNA